MVILQSNKIILYETQSGEIKLDVTINGETVWLNVEQLCILFGRDRSVIQRHIKNIYDEQEVERRATCADLAQVQEEGKRQITRQVPHYNLDVIISLGYRVKSKQGTQFRIWANQVLKDYIIQGYAGNKKRLDQLGKAIQIMQRMQDKLQARQVLDVIQRYESALNLLDDYDHKRIGMPSGNTATYSLSYEECRQLIDGMGIDKGNALFGNEKDDSFRGALAAVNQTFDGQELYPTLEEKAANLLYFIVKDHSFSDGNKRIAAAIFLNYLDMNNALLRGSEKRIADDTLVALIIMLAESIPQEKQTMVNLVMQFLSPWVSGKQAD